MSKRVFDFGTDECYGGGKTIFGAPKWFDPRPKNKLKLILDCDKHTLEFRLLKEEKSFWKIALPKENKNLLHYPFVLLDGEGLSATFCWDD